MTRNEYLLTIVSEECAEIQQAVSKVLRFGTNGYHPDNPVVSNGEWLLVEYYQLEEMIEMLFEAEIVEPFSLSDIIRVRENKREKVLKYMEVSKHLGCLEDR